MTEKFFNTAGPMIAEDHYHLPHRYDWNQVKELIERKNYFVLHAPRQTGKTTAILEITKRLNSEGDYKALYVNVETAQSARNDVDRGIETILAAFEDEIRQQLGLNEKIPEWQGSKIRTNYLLYSFLSEWAKFSDKPLILFIDEIDSLIGDTLIAVLRQLRSGYKSRPTHFPQSVCLVGVRDVRDYRIWSEENNSFVLGGSAFNIKSESLRLGDFTKEEVEKLYVQHTDETGQKFEKEAIEHAMYLTNGQPWLVNALAYQVCFRDIRDRTIEITKEHIEKAKEDLILRRDTHLDQLVDKLREERVRNIIDEIINGESQSNLFPTDDVQYVADLGLISIDEMKISNPIYKEIIPRELTYVTQKTITQNHLWYVNKDGSLDMQKLLARFQEFYRENSEIWLEKFDYKESGPHLLMMAFLQRIINAKGKIYREYGLGRRRVDLLIEWEKQRIVIELKIYRNEKTLLQGLEQTADYMDTSNATEGHLIIFNRDATKAWDEKVDQRQESYQSHAITVWGC